MIDLSLENKAKLGAVVCGHDAIPKAKLCHHCLTDGDEV
jgi:hypothetical protein